MNILFVVPYVPSLVRSRSYNIIRALTERGNHVTVLTVWANEQEKAEAEALKHQGYDVQGLDMPLWRTAVNCVVALPGSSPLQSVFSWHPGLLAGLNGRISYDVAHVEHLRGSRYGLYLKQKYGLPVVWDSVDCITHLFRQAATNSKSVIGRLRSRLDLGRTEKYEGWLLHQFDHAVITSPVDRQALLALSPNPKTAAPVTVIGHGVDINYFSPDPATPREPATLVISGKMSYHANITMTLHLVENIMPMVWAKRPDVKLWVVGKDPAREIQALGEQNSAVIVTGTVPDMRPYLRQATAAVTPVTYGAGIQNKVLEAMACATPVITTPQTTAALQAVPEQDLLVAQDPHTFAEAILRLLDDPARQQQLGETGRAYVEKHHHWDNIAAQLEEIYRRAMSKESVL